ncbi:MAG: glycosyltransferase [Desulfuromonadaceae bacterium]|nr:glycosyltransferase [Desulfuromonadaceae bacterium]MDD2848559.1 glycosyltransferase [Desulfuromonadaceae bacterium]MDD4131539.1 glycosyltransferase [Desulfuromonadaceae bacterium]
MTRVPVSKVNLASKPIVVFFEHVTVLDRFYLHKFLIAQAHEFINTKSIIYFCTMDDSKRLQKEFLDKYIPGALAINYKDKKSLKQIVPVAVFVSSVLTALKLGFSNPFKICQYHHILWYQGIIPEESFLRRKSYLRKFVLICVEQLAIRWADVVLLPSDAMKEYLWKHKRLPQKKYVTIPNAIDNIPSIFLASRELWGLGDDNTPTIGYCGGISTWQCFEETVMLVSDLQRLCPELWFLVLTYDPHNAQEILQRQKMSRFIIRTSAPEDTYRYVQAFDLGLLLRRSHPINAVSFPLKYLDYMANGVPVCTTSAVDAIREDAEQNHGLVIDLDRNEAEKVLDHLLNCVKAKEQIRDELRNHASQQWTWKSANAESRQVYADIIGM